MINVTERHQAKPLGSLYSSAKAEPDLRVIGPGAIFIGGPL